MRKQAKCSPNVADDGFKLHMARSCCLPIPVAPGREAVAVGAGVVPLVVQSEVPGGGQGARDYDWIIPHVIMYMYSQWARDLTVRYDMLYVNHSVFQGLKCAARTTDMAQHSQLQFKRTNRRTKRAVYIKRDRAR